MHTPIKIEVHELQPMNHFLLGREFELNKFTHRLDNGGVYVKMPSGNWIKRASVLTSEVYEDHFIARYDLLGEPVHVRVFFANIKFLNEACPDVFCWVDK